MVDHRFNTPFYKRLRGFVSTQAQSLIFDELKRSATIGVDSSLVENSLLTSVIFDYQHRFLTNVETTYVKELNVNIVFMKTNVNIHYTRTFLKKSMSHNQQ